MQEKFYTKTQLIALFVFRLIIGWHILYEGLIKLFNPNWSSLSFLRESKWIFSGFANWIITNESALKTADFLNVWGLIAIGLGLMFGLFARAASLAGALLVLTYYLITPPLIGLDYSIPLEGNYLIVNKTLIEAVALFILFLFPTSKVYGLDRLIFKPEE